ncbi:GNAT family N-acetyltransferase [Streptomyces sp. NPDC046275]|uniref:GNAT family N-acetyltransferase n=1 Tax=Streptomyces sp. NPDC046275 TaxID=3157201 RepID=UPI003410625C
MHTNPSLEESRHHPALPALLSAYHLATEAEKGRPVAGPDELPERYRAEAADPAGAFAGDTVLVAGPGEGCVVLTAGGELKRLWVAPEARGRGLATALVTEALRRAVERGIGPVRLSVWQWRTDALALYRRLGFRPAEPWDAREGLLFLEWCPGAAEVRRLTPGEVRERAADGWCPGAAEVRRLAPGEVGERAADGWCPGAAEVRRLAPGEVRERAAEGLAALLVDAVDDGASIGFLAPLDPAEAAAWWTEAAGVREVWAALDPRGRVLGAVTLARDGKANGRHRGEIARLVVHREARGQGIARRLLAAAEAHAAATGLTLLVLDTQTDSPAERLYRATGWTPAGTIPDFAADPSGTLRPTTLYYKRLAP